MYVPALKAEKLKLPLGSLRVLSADLLVAVTVTVAVGLPLTTPDMLKADTAVLAVLAGGVAAAVLTALVLELELPPPQALNVSPTKIQSAVKRGDRVIEQSSGQVRGAAVLGEKVERRKVSLGRDRAQQPV